MKKRLLTMLTALSCCATTIQFPTAHAEGDVYEIYVSSVQGSDTTGNGGIEAPYQTVEKAQEIISSIKPDFSGEIRVILREGEYPPIALTADASGTENIRVTYTGYEGEEAVVTNSTTLSPDDFNPVTDSKILVRIPENARASVRVLDLTEYGITSVPELGELQNANTYAVGAGLFIDDTYMTTARWPDEGYVKFSDFAKVTSTVSNTDDNKTFTDADITITYNPDYHDFSRWTTAEKAYFCGFFNYSYFFKYMSLESVDTAKSKMNINQLGMSTVRTNAKMFVNNLIEELSAPGEWYLDTDNFKIYIYPPHDITNSKIRFVHKDMYTVYTEGSIPTNYTTIENLTINGSYQTAVRLYGSGKHNILRNCIIKNGCADAVAVTCSDTLINSNHIYNMGMGGVRIYCYSNPAINDAFGNTGNLVTNNKIHDYALIQRAYAGGIYTYGAGGEISHNEIYNAPWSALTVAGINTDVLYNDIHDVLTDSGDAGAMYIGGPWTTRGHNVCYNKIYNIYSNTDDGNMGIYLDDIASANNICSNIIDSATGNGIFVNGGRDNVLRNNVITNTYGSNEERCGIQIAEFTQESYDKRLASLLSSNSYADKTKFASYFEKWPLWEETISGGKHNKPYNTVVENNIFAGYLPDRAIYKYVPSVGTGYPLPEEWNATVQNNLQYASIDGIYKDIQNGDLRYEIPKGSDIDFSFTMLGADKNYQEWFLDDISENYDAEIAMTVEQFADYDTDLKGEYYGARFLINNRYCPLFFSVEKDGIYYADENNEWVMADCDYEILENVKYTYEVKVRGKSCEFYINGEKQFDFQIEVPEVAIANANYDYMNVEYKLPKGVETAFCLHSIKLDRIYQNEVIIDSFEKENTNRTISGLTNETLTKKLYNAQNLLAITGEDSGDTGTYTYTLPDGYYITDFSVEHTHSGVNVGKTRVILNNGSSNKTVYDNQIDRSFVYGHNGFRYIISPKDDYKSGTIMPNKYNKISVTLERTVAKSAGDYPKLIRVVIEYKKKTATQDTDKAVTIYDKNLVFDNCESASMFIKASSQAFNYNPYVTLEMDGVRYSNTVDYEKIEQLFATKAGQKVENDMRMYEAVGYTLLGVGAVKSTVLEDSNKYYAQFITENEPDFTAILAAYDSKGKLTAVKSESITDDKTVEIPKNGANTLKIMAWNNISECEPLDYCLVKK